MSTTLAFRLILGLVVGGVLTCSVWDRNDRELKEQPADEDTRTGMPRFRSFAAAETLPTMLVMYLAISLAIGGREMAVQYLLGLLLRVFLLIGVYYVLLLAVMPLLRRHISARVCAVLWLLPGYLYFLTQVSSVQRADPGGERMLVLHASGTLVTVLLAVWAAGAIGVFAWKIISHLRFRRRVLKDAVVVTDEQTLAVWKAELARAWIEETKWTLVRAPQLTTPLSIGLFQKTTCVALPACSYTPEELSLILRHEIIHLSRRDPASKFFMVFCTAMCWFNPLMWVAMRKSADDFELSCDESVLLAQPQPVRRQYAELLLKTAGDERGFTTCLSATASALRYRLKSIMAPGKKHTGALLVGLTFLLLTLCAGHVALAYDAQPGAARIFDGRPPEDFSLRYVDVWNDDRGSGTDFGCTDEAALKDYLAALQLETYTEALDRYGKCRSLQLLFDAPEGTLSVTLADNQSIHVTRLWLKNAPSESYYLAEPIDWQLLDRLIVPRPALRVWFSLPGQDEDSCFFAGVYSMTQTLPDGTVQVLQEPDEGNYSAFGTTGGGRTVRLEFGQTLLEPYTVTCQTPDGSERRIFTQDELRGGCVPLLPGESADYTVAARLQGEDGSTYDAVFCFRYDRLAGET